MTRTSHDMSVCTRALALDLSKMPIKQRRQARQDGDELYYTGVPCGRGHYAPRLTATADCTACTDVQLKRSRRRTAIKRMRRLVTVRHDYDLPNLQIATAVEARIQGLAWYWPGHICYLCKQDAPHRGIDNNCIACEHGATAPAQVEQVADLKNDGSAIAHARRVALEPFPCEGCKWTHYCRDHLTACRAFGVYTNKGPSTRERWRNQNRQPSKEVYRKLYPEESN